MNKEIRTIINRVKFGLVDRNTAQEQICSICMEDDNSECGFPCQSKRMKRRWYHGKGCKVELNPQNMESIQLANLDRNVAMATIQMNPRNRAKRINKTVRIPMTKGDAHKWTAWWWYIMGSERWPVQPKDVTPYPYPGD